VLLTRMSVNLALKSAQVTGLRVKFILLRGKNTHVFQNTFIRVISTRTSMMLIRKVWK
jgi:hypothetical protein